MNEQQYLNYFFDNIKVNTINLLINKINETKNNIYIIGVGKSYNLALQTADLLKSISINCFHLDTQKLLHGDMGIINNNLVIIFSKSGNTNEILNIMDKLIQRNCYLVGVFCNSRDLTRNFNISDSLSELNKGIANCSPKICNKIAALSKPE